MLKQTVEYTDFDDNKSVETLYFNITKSELAENLHLQTDLEKIQAIIEGDRRDMNRSEIQLIIDLVKTFMKMSYGIRSADGKRFVKTDEIWNEFTQTAAYDAFLFSMFEKPNQAIDFMTGILPLDLRDKARETVEKEMKKASVPQGANIIDTTKGPDTYEGYSEGAGVINELLASNPAPTAGEPAKKLADRDGKASDETHIPKTDAPTKVEVEDADMESFKEWQRQNGLNKAAK